MLFRSLANKLNVPVEDAAIIMDTFFESMREALLRGDRIEIRGFGSFKIQRYRWGVPEAPLAVVGETDKTGTQVYFRPDEEIFEEMDFQYEVLAKCFEELAYLNPGIQIEFFDEKSQNRDVFRYEGGIISFVKNKNQDNGIHRIIGGSGETDGVTIDFALQYTAGCREIGRASCRERV